VTAGPAVIPEGKNEAEIVLRAAPDTKPGTSSQVAMASAGTEAWRPVRIASGGGEGAAFARVTRATVVVAEKPSFSLEASSTSVNVPQGGSAVIPLTIRREPGFDTPVTFHMENLPPGVTLEPASAAAGQPAIELTIRAANHASRGRAARVAILGTSGQERQEAPRISIQVD
jgi:hypothetical protein